MYTRRIDAVLDALANCRERIPPLCELYQPGSPQRASLENLLKNVNRTHAVMSGPKIVDHAPMSHLRDTG